MALWSGRFSEGPSAAVRDFTESISFDGRLYKHDIAGSLAHVAALASAGIITDGEAGEISQGLREIERRIDAGEFEFTPELEDIHMHVESALIELVGDVGGKLHSGRSRNDQIALDIRLYCREAVSDTVSGLRSLQRALVSAAERAGDALLPGLTHLKHAQPVLFAHHLLAYVEMFERDLSRLEDCARRFDVLPLGAGALAGSSLPLDRGKVAELLGFSAVSANSMDSVASRDHLCELVSCLAIFAVNASRLAEDMTLWSSDEFAFVEFGDAFCTGSSLMPQKKNPDVAELTRGKSARVVGDLVSLLTLCKGLPLTYNRDLQEDKEPLFDALDTVLKTLSVLPPMLDSMELDSERMLEAASDPALMATDLAEELVRDGVPFRNAHHQVGALVKWCRENGVALNSLTLDQMRGTVPEAKESYLEIFSPRRSVEAKRTLGSTCPSEVRGRMDVWKKRLEEHGA
jgi:argininosuccinate lyase